ncbi:MAG: hypothetical protein P8K77_07460 [Polaribacter sp.]|nr:hypothetical protein [Polaribacter sp.]
MNTTNFITLLKHPDKIQKEEASSLKSIIDTYPYFQAARAIYLKSLNAEKSFKYNSELKITAAYTSDRTILFDFITSSVFTKSETPLAKATEVHHQISEKISSEKPEAIKRELSIGKPIHFTQNETHSFNEWLQLSAQKKIERTTSSASQKPDKATLIDNFIKQNPKISRINKQAEYVVKISESNSHSSIMTETLAKVYLEQKKYENAIKAYEILSLKYPEKSGFFADQIKRVQILQKNKS